ARLGDNIRNSASGVSVRCAHVVGLDVELLQSIGAWEGEVGVDIAVVIIHAIQQVVNAVGAAAIDLRILFTGQNATFAVVAAVLRADIDGSGHKKDQFLRCSSVHGQAHHGLFVDDLGDGRVIGGDLVHVSLHRN